MPAPSWPNSVRRRRFRDARLGVSAGEPPGPGVGATEGPQGWRLGGRKAWCSGAGVLTAALGALVRERAAR
jgi:hypothetical protein